MNPSSPDGGSTPPKDEIDVAVPGYGDDMQPVVGLGGSAGAIPALVTFLQSAPPAAALSYVVKDTVYVIPPRHALRMNDGQLQLEDMPQDTPGHVAVDLFFRALADTHGARPRGR
jgi:two-component system CheB/CheR fusion protein